MSFSHDFKYACAINVEQNSIYNSISYRTTVAAHQGRYDMITQLFSQSTQDMDPLSHFTSEEGNITMDELFLTAAHDKHDLIVE